MMDDFLPAIGRAVCLAKRHAAHFGFCMILQAALWSCLEDSVLLRTPEPHEVLDFVEVNMT